MRARRRQSVRFLLPVNKGQRALRAAGRCGGPAGRREQGFVLIEFAIASLILILVAVWAAHAWAQRVRDLQAQSLAVWMMAAHDGARAYLGRHGPALALAEGPDALQHEGFDDWRTPAWHEMRLAGLLPPGWTETGPMGLLAGLQIQRSGDCPGGACRLMALVHTRDALVARDGRTVDESLVAQWLMAVQGKGLVVWPHAPDVLSGAARRLPAPGGWQPGTVALAADGGHAEGAGGQGDADLDLTPYLRLGDERDPAFQGDATIDGSVSSGASLRARDYLVLSRNSDPQEACDEEGAFSFERGRDGTLLCRGGRWRSAGRADGGGFLLHSHRGCVDAVGAFRGNPVTGDCSCPFGYQPVMVSDMGATASAEGRTTGFICVVGD